MPDFPIPSYGMDAPDDVTAPLDLGEWMQGNAPDEKLIWKAGLADQARVFYDLGYLLTTVDPEDRWNTKTVRPTVVSTHRSKSVTLPVVRLQGKALTTYLRGNFHNWIVSVECDSPREALYLRQRDLLNQLCSHGLTVHEVYAEGFSSAWVWPSFDESPLKFTTELSYSTFGLWTFFWLMTRP